MSGPFAAEPLADAGAGHGRARRARARARPRRRAIEVDGRPVGLMRDYERGAGGTWHDGLLMDLLRGDLTDG